MSRSSRKPTLLDVADSAGVSKSTVSRVLNGDNYVSSASRDSVLRAVDQLGYRPNSVARSLRTRRSLSVGFVVPSLSNDVYGALAEGATRLLEQSDRTLLVSVSGNDAHLELKAIQHLLARDVEGLILALADERSREVTSLLKATGTPIVLIDRDLPGIITADRILVDHETSVIAAANRLRDFGHEHVAVLAPPASIRPGREVARAFTSIFPTATVIHGPLVFDHGRTATASILSESPRTTGVLVAGTQVFAGAVTTIKEAGLEIPSDISIIGYDESSLSQLFAPSVDTITRDIVGIGTMAAQLLLSRLDQGRDSAVTTTIASHYQARESVGPPSAID